MCKSDRLFGCAKGVSGWFEYDKTMEKKTVEIYSLTEIQDPKEILFR